jgi:hypothetical protein
MVCTPENVEAGAKCFQSIPAGRQWACLIYLFNYLSGLNMTPAQLDNASRCFQSIPQGRQLACLLYLACNISGTGGGSGGGFSGSGPPTTQNPAANAGFYFDYTNDIVYFWNPAANGGAGGWTQ